MNRMKFLLSIDDSTYNKVIAAKQRLEREVGIRKISRTGFIIKLLELALKTLETKGDSNAS